MAACCCSLTCRCLAHAGWAVSGFYGYLKGVQNEMADKYLPSIAPRNDSLAGPQGRKSDQARTNSGVSICTERNVLLY